MNDIYRVPEESYEPHIIIDVDLMSNSHFNDWLCAILEEKKEFNSMKKK